jgi:hypothetical protein
MFLRPWALRGQTFTIDSHYPGRLCFYAGFGFGERPSFWGTPFTFTHLHIYKTPPHWVDNYFKCEKMKGIPTYRLRNLDNPQLASNPIEILIHRHNG